MFEVVPLSRLKRFPIMITHAQKQGKAATASVYHDRPRRYVRYLCLSLLVLLRPKKVATS